MKPYMATRITFDFVMFLTVLAILLVVFLTMTQMGGPESMSITGNDASKFLSNPLARWLTR